MTQLRIASKKILLLLIFVVLVAGCGSNDGDFVITSTSDDPGVLTPVVVGRLNLGNFTDVEGAQISLVSPSGSVLAQGTANQNGHVFFENVTVPRNFRAVATVPGSQVEFCAEIRDFQHNNKHARISLLTTLACRYQALHPELTIDQAETRLKELLAIPPQVDIALGPQAINPFFSDIAFFRAAAASGGIETLLAQLDEFDAAQGQLLAAPSRSFLLTIDQLDRPIPTGVLDQGLHNQVEASRLALADRLRIAQATGDQLNIRYTPSISFVAGPASLGGQFLLGIGTGLAGNVATAGVNAVIGWAANQMGLNYGTAGQLNEIEGELNQLTSLVENFTKEYTTNTLDTDFDTITGYFDSNSSGGADVKDDNSDLNSALQVATAPTGQPFTPPSGVVTLNQNIRSNFDNNAYNGALNQSNTNLSAQTGFLKTYQTAYTYDSLGLDDSSTAAALNLPWRSNHILDVTNSMYEHFSQWQVQTLNLIAEASHVYPNNPVETYSKAQQNIAAGVANMKSQRQLLPLYASQWGTIADLDNAVMWWETFYYADTWSHANSFADGLSVQVVFPDGSTRTYDDWRLPTYGEFVSLQNRGRYNPTADSTVPVNTDKGVGDTGRSTAGLPSLGFYQVSDTLTTEQNNSGNDNAENGDLWMNEGNGTDTFLSDFEFRLNHSNNNVSGKSDKDDNVYVLCRTFGPDNVTWNEPSTIPSAAAGSDLVAGEILQYGVPTSISVTSTEGPSSVTFPPNAYSGFSQNVTLPLPANTLQFVASVDYSLTLGGSFKVGASGNQESYSNTSHTHTATVSTASNPNQPNYLAELVNWSSSNSQLLEIFNLPYLSGVAIPRTTSQQVTVTASLRGAGGTVVSGSTAITPQAASPKVLQSIQITPRNVIYGGSGIAPSTGSPRFYATGFYSDGTIEDLSLQVTWDSTPYPNASDAQVRTDSGGAFLNLSTSSGDTTTFNLNISASIDNGSGTTITDSTTVEITPTSSN